MDGVTIHTGCVLDVLRGMAPASVHCAVTSPPYWSLRDYGLPPSRWPDGWEGCLGLEPDPDQFVAHLVHVFALVRRALRPDGTLWVNLGDSFCAGNQQLLPHRFALAMQADGWRLRSTIVWHKRSPMPESLSGWRWVQCRVKERSQQRDTLTKVGANRRELRPSFPHPDNGIKTVGAEFIPCPGCPKCEPNGGLVLRRGKWRPTTAHEYIFLFSGPGDYFGDAEAVAEAVAGTSHHQSSTDGKKTVEAEATVRNNISFKRKTLSALAETRNPRSVMSFSNEPYKGSHFAAYPSRLPKFCIEAGTSPQVCAACGAPWAPIVCKERIATRPGDNTKATGDRMRSGNRDAERHVSKTTVEGYRPTCGCQAGSAPAVVLDPFLGSGTTLQAARALGRSGIGIELNPAYVALAEARIATPPKWATKKIKRQKKQPTRPERLLF